MTGRNTSILRSTRVIYWPGGRGPEIKPKHGVTLTDHIKKGETNFGTGGYWVIKDGVGGSTFIADTHIEREPDPVLFGEPEPPSTGVSIDPDDPAGWKYPPVSLQAAADAVRPFLAAGVSPLEVAVLALDAFNDL